MSTTWRIGLWVPSGPASRHDHAMVTWARGRPGVELVVLQAPGVAAHEAAQPSMLARLVTAMETSQLRRHPRYKSHLASAALDNATSVTLPALRALNLDLIVSTGTLLPSTDAIAATRLGALAFDWADPGRRDRLAPGFSEVLHRRDTTGFRIVLHRADAPSAVLASGRVPTRHYHLLNQAALCEKANHYLRDLLDRMVDTGALPAAQASLPSDAPTIAEPGIGPMAGYLKRSLAATIGKKLDKARGLEEHWQVSFARSDWSHTAMASASLIPNPPGRYLADPFVIRREGRDICFVEDFNCATQRGAISAYELKGTNAERLGIVIDEPFHMSFPYLFELDGALYMCPETSEQREIRVYRCTEFPLKWQLEKVLMSQVNAVDSMLFERDGRWWMLTNIDPAGTGEICSELFLFSADSPLSTSWQAHAANPVLFDAGHARNGGLLSDGISLYRVSQRQGFDRYGKGSQINQIVRLDDEHYEERCVAVIEPSFRPGLRGTHHMHSRDGITVFDSLTKAKARSAATTS